ncbi:U6 snRNA phosphodiesterase isoform X1 [Paramuricea clavata]|uniref:U6 snRNA phosphodiesterase n=1 Tax=Paramuricea clavata TaxID=317549 RepID=A0A6S7FUR7_PARCT|nr:U6 snRNA phosphodiesterase isoform X1 [Paramuricea clavata]
MNSLKQLAAIYGEDDDDDEEDFTSSATTQIDERGMKRSREDEQDEVDVLGSSEAEKLSKIKLEIPTGVLDMFKESDDSESSNNVPEHQGRLRSFEHFPGNWATHIFVPFDLPESFPEFLTSLQKAWPREASELHMCDLHDFHVSISRTVPIRHHWIEPLKELLQRGFQGKRKFVCDFRKVGIYVNDEKTRTFVALDVIIGVSQLKDLVQVVDKAFQEFGLPKYYDKPSFHASCAWSLGDVSENISPSTLAKIQNSLDSYVEDNSSLVLTAEETRCQTGNKVFHFHLM